MRRSYRPFLFAVLVVAVAVAACSKKSASPTAPPPPEDPTCLLSAGALSFGAVAVGSSLDRTLTLTNTGTGTLAGTALVGCAEFTLVGASAYSLGAGESATLTVRFSPTAVGAKACTLATGSARCARVPCTGSGQSTTPECYLPTTFLDFGTVEYASVSNRSLVIENHGGGTLNGTVTGLPIDFSVIGSPTFSLGPGQQAVLLLEFQPTTGRAQQCTLRVEPPGCSPVVLRGVGDLPIYGQCNLYVSSGDTLDFGPVSVGQTVTQFVTVRNGGSLPSIGGPAEWCPDFEANFDASFSPGASGPRPVSFTPSRTGLQYCAVPFYCRMSGSGAAPGVNYYLICRGVGVSGTPVCQLSTSTLDFGLVTVGHTKDLSFQVTNTGSGILSGTVGPSNCPGFSFIGATSYGLTAGASATFTVRYTPSNPGHTTTCPLIPAGSSCGTLTFFGEAVAP